MRRTGAFRIHRTGGPDVLTWEHNDLPRAGPGQIVLRQTAVGINFADIYYRTGLYPASLPSGIGYEAAGVVEEIGEGVDDLQPGDRVVYASPQLGAYAEARTMSASHVVKLPRGLADDQAAAVMLQGMTAQCLLRRVHAVQRGETILVHAAAGGVGLILCQWAAALGATVIGTVGTDEKAELARAHGCAHPIVYTRENFVARVMDLTAGAKLPVVFDSVGRDTFLSSLDCLRPFGLLVSFGQSSGAIAPFEPKILAAKGSLFLTRPTLWNYVASRQDLLSTAADLFDTIMRGSIKLGGHRSFPLKDAAGAQELLERRATVGKSVLIP